jgi:predicted amidohydrolase YtcJ
MAPPTSSLLPARPPSGPASIVFRGGHVHTVDDANQRAEAVAVVGERIAAVGSAADVEGWIGPRTRVVDLGGRLLVPGFQDAHVHPISGGLDRLQCDVRESRGVDGVLATIRHYADAHPELEWIVGSGWYMADFPNGTPRREDLDRVVPDRPAFLPNRDGHSAWVNTTALTLAGVDRETPDPAGGRIERDPDGTPTGALHETAADLVEDLLPPTSDEEWYEGLKVGQAYLHALGITAWQDAIVTPPYERAYRRGAAEGTLTGRVEAAMWWDRERGLEQVDELVERSRLGSIGRLRSNSVKLMLDGVVETFTALVLEPYLGHDGTPTTNRGICFIDPEVLAEAVVRLDRLGLQAHFHALAEGAVRLGLDAVEAARTANGPSDTRPHLAHIQVVHPDDLPRFKALGAVANAQALWAAHEDQMDVLTIPFLGAERSAWQYPFGSLLRAGARLAMGSDWSVSSPDPLTAIEVAVTRMAPPRPDPGMHTKIWDAFLPEERISLEQALRAYTLGSAYVNHLDDETGSIQVGKLADLAVVDVDPFAPGGPSIGSGRVLGTLVGGSFVFEDPALG